MPTKKLPAKPTTAHLNQLALFLVQGLEAGAALHGHPCLDSKRPFGSSNVEGAARWTEATRPPHALRARAIVTAARDAARAGYSVQVVGLLGGLVSGRTETMRRLVYARAEGLVVRQHLLPAEFGGVVVEAEGRAA